MLTFAAIRTGRIREGSSFLKETGSFAKCLSGPAAQIATAAFIATGMAIALAVRFLLHNPHVNIVLCVAIAGASLPLMISLVQQVIRKNFSVDILALLSIVTALILGQYWVAAIVVLMLSGGKALESYATERANSVLSALAKRMPQTAHRVGEVVSDVSIDSIVSAGEERSHCGRFKSEPVVHPGEPPVDGDAVRTLHQFLN